MEIGHSDIFELRRAKTCLETPSLATRLTDLVGTPIEKGFSLLPAAWSQTLQQVTHVSLEKALHVSMLTLRNQPGRRSSERRHKLLAAASGAMGGAFGMPGLLIELPATTMLMLRAIGAIARNEGESIRSPEVKLACLEVFALGSGPKARHAAETGYFAVRGMLSRSISEAARSLAESGLSAESAPAVVRLISQVASFFGVAVSEKMAAQALPVVGAAGGAAVNTIFVNHFQNTARGHFIIRRLERKYGREEVHRLYEEL